MSSRKVGVYLVSSRKVGVPCVIKKGRSILLIMSSRKVGVPCVWCEQLCNNKEN